LFHAQSHEGLKIDLLAIFAGSKRQEEKTRISSYPGHTPEAQIYPENTRVPCVGWPCWFNSRI